MESETHVNSKGKDPLYREKNSPQMRVEPTKQDAEPTHYTNELFRPEREAIRDPLHPLQAQQTTGPTKPADSPQFVYWLVVLRPSNMRVHFRDGSAKTSLHAATLRQKLQIKLSISPSHGIPTSGQPVPEPTLQRQAPGRVATGVPILKSLV